MGLFLTEELVFLTEGQKDMFFDRRTEKAIAGEPGKLYLKECGGTHSEVPPHKNKLNHIVVLFVENMQTLS